jgi:predicted ATPase/class 3 adenylate cyclase
MQAQGAEMEDGKVRTFLFTDVEGSTRLWESQPVAMRNALADHDDLVRRAVAAHRGTLVKMIGDGAHVAFEDAADAIAATVELQRGLRELAGRHGIALKVRCGLHAGTCEMRDGDFFGAAVNRAARIMGAASGGQVLLSQAVVEAAAERLPDAAAVADLGEVRLRDLARPVRVYELRHPDLDGPFPPLRSLDATPNNLPLVLTSFVGREDDVRRAREVLAGDRLVTITGTGGIGKTRLALQVAAEAIDRFGDGVWLVDLSALSDGGRIGPAIAQVLGLREEDEPVESTLSRYVADRRMLLILDNCEHLLDACARIVSSLLAGAADLRVLATSREALGVGGERVLALAPLDVSAPDGLLAQASPAASLFVDRARDKRPDFVPGSRDLRLIDDIVRQLDGIPLAIELAAARTHALTLADIAARLPDRFRLIAGGPRGSQPRQRTLEALIGWSYDLLAAEEKRAFAGLSVFAGGFDLAAAEAVCGAAGTLDLVDALVAKSLVVAYPRAGGMRYRMLDSIREFARARLAERDDADEHRDRHVLWCASLARAAYEAMRSPREAAFIERLDDEQENLRSAIARACARPSLHQAALTLTAKLWRYWHMSGRMSEGRGHVERALAVSAGAPASLPRADALYAAGALAKNQGDLVHAARRLNEACAMYEAQGAHRDAAAALGSLGNVRQDQGDCVAARRLHEQALDLFRRVGDRSAEATALLNLGSVAMDLGEWQAAQGLHEEALALARKIGVGAVECLAEANLGDLALYREDAAGARPHFERALARSREVRFRGVEATALVNLAALVDADGDPAGARAMAREGIQMLHEAGSKGPLIDALETVAELFALEGDSAMAADLLAAAIEARQALGVGMTPRGARARARTRALVGERRAARAWTLAEAVEASLDRLGDTPSPAQADTRRTNQHATSRRDA